MPFRIETDAALRRALGTDGAEWASAYIKQAGALGGDARHIELTAWFDAAIANGFKLARRTQRARDAETSR